ncbi:MAG: hypothetical protein ACYDG3_12285, partial [Bacillati bacterium]
MRISTINAKDPITSARHAYFDLHGHLDGETFSTLARRIGLPIADIRRAIKPAGKRPNHYYSKEVAIVAFPELYCMIACGSNDNDIIEASDVWRNHVDLDAETIVALVAKARIEINDAVRRTYGRNLTFRCGCKIL